MSGIDKPQQRTIAMAKRVVNFMDIIESSEGEGNGDP